MTPPAHTHTASFILGPGQEANFTTDAVEPLLDFMRISDPMATFLVHNAAGDGSITVLSRGAVSVLRIVPIR